MIKVYKHVIPNTKFTDLSDGQSATYEYVFDVQPQTLSVILKVNDEIKYNIFLTLETLQSLPAFCSQAWFGLSSLSGHVIQSQDQISVTREMLVSLLDISKTGKRITLQSYDDTNKSIGVPIRIFVDSANSDFTDFSYTVQWPEESFDENIENTITISGNVTLQTEQKNWKDFFSNITATGVVTNDTIEVTVQTEDTDIDFVYAEPIVGLLDRTKIKLTNGVGKFNIIKSSLESGDEAEVKLGYQKFSNVTTFKQIIA